MASFRLAFVLLVFGGGLVAASSAPPGCYRAAVLDHVHQSGRTETNETDTGRNVELNLEVYEEAAKLAKEKGADIVVFPENGLVYGLLTRHLAERFAVDIPDLNQAPLCSIDAKAALERLSCLAAKYEMFIAANLLDRKTCEELHLDVDDKKCPRDKKFIFNTAVLFDRQGKLIAKYHKMHLFGEMSLNPPPKPELVVVDTELGKLGLQICFDMIFETPGHRLAKEHKIDTMVFPTWWFDEAPLLGSSQYQMAWAFGNNISLLASNIHKVELGSRGSGIYNGRERKFANALYDDHVERLVIADVPIKADGKTQCPLNSETVVVPQKIPVRNHSQYNHQNLNLKDTELVQLNKTQDTVSVCHDGVCCTLEYQLETSAESCNEINEATQTCSPLIINDSLLNPNERYYLMASNRTRPGNYHWTEEFCALVQCPEHGCRRFGTDGELSTKFRNAKLTGKFSPTATIYPSAVGSKHQLLHPDADHWNFERSANDQYQIWYHGYGPLATLAMYGRVYERDPLYEQKDTGINL